MLERIKHGTCPFTGKPYDCSRCETYKDLKLFGGQNHFGGTAHLSIYFGEAIRDGKRGIRWLKKMVGGDYTPKQIEEYFTALFMRGSDHHPVGECDRFCFRKGCMGHVREGGEKKEGESK